MAPAETTRRWWQERLGAIPDPAGTWRRVGVRDLTHPGAQGRIHQLGIRSFGSELLCELLLPTTALSTRVVVVAPFYDTPPLFSEPSPRTAAHGRDPADSAFGLRLAQAGHAVLAVPWWFEQVAAADPATAGARELRERYGPAAERHRREQPASGLGRSIADLMLAVTALEESGLAPDARLASFGHSLGGKLSLHLAALDTRIEAAAAHEPGLGFSHSNWADPWYLDGDLPVGRDQDELLGLVAPRPFLLAGGGSGDGVHTLDLFRSARRRWPEERGLDLLLHDGGHSVPPHVMAAVGAWFQARLPQHM